MSRTWQRSVLSLSSRFHPTANRIRDPGMKKFIVVVVTVVIR